MELNWSLVSFQDARLVSPNNDLRWWLLPVSSLTRGCHQQKTDNVLPFLVWICQLFSSLTADGGEEPTRVDWQMVNRLPCLLFYIKTNMSWLIAFCGFRQWGRRRNRCSRQTNMIYSYFQGPALSTKTMKKHWNGWEQQWEKIEIHVASFESESKKDHLYTNIFYWPFQGTKDPLQTN